MTVTAPVLLQLSGPLLRGTCPALLISHTSVLPFCWAAPGARLQSVQLFKLQSPFQNVALLFGPTEPWQLQNIVGRFLTRAIASIEKDSIALIFAYDQWSKSLRIWNMTKMLSRTLVWALAYFCQTICPFYMVIYTLVTSHQLQILLDTGTFVHIKVNLKGIW